ncbi:hypothetical protein NDU88_009981 [Pleurodeles waltl]|uniref:Uncharacterized protein n=1 Tax=Pleurodeles waltl TaxID=8319 RepID=A0AAV7QT40_PLEWA|nr:hypothetical protein NDU88_009981 [Pleurodeles waltl]
MYTLKSSVAILEAKTHKLEAKVEDAEGRARRCNRRIVGFPEGVEGANVEAFLEDWIHKTLPEAPLSAVFVVERAHRALTVLLPPGAPHEHCRSSTYGYSVCEGWTIGMSGVSECCLDLNQAIEWERRSPPTSGL